MSRLVTKPTKWHVHPAKTQISLGICPVWSVFTVCMKKAWVLSNPLSGKQRLIRLSGCPSWSVFAGRSHFVGFVMRWLKCIHALSEVCYIRKWATTWQNQQNDVHPVKSQISLGICHLIRAFSVCFMDSLGPNISSCGQRRLWSD